MILELDRSGDSYRYYCYSFIIKFILDESSVVLLSKTT